uniref:Retrotransposon gag domain-containing protein n=1 Tax=Fagus sylvatica TaxID=28930 RepID=A0A2N9HDH6_FAGSY
MAEERVVQPEAPRMTMYQLLHPTQSSIPSCIMFPPNAPHVEIKQGLMAILPDFRGLENENPYVHVRAFEEDKAKGWLYTLKTRSIGSWGEMTQEFYKKFFPPHKVQQVKRKISNFAQGNDETLFMAWERFKDTYNFCPTHGYDTWRLKEPEDAMDYLDEIVENSNTWNGPSPLDSRDRNRSSIITSDGSVFRLTEEDNMNVKISLLTKDRGTQAEGKPPLEDVLYTFIQKQGEQNQRFETMFTRIDEEMKETKSQVARLIEALSRTKRGKLPFQTQPNPNSQIAKVVNIDKFEEVKSITILRSGKEIGKCAPKANEKSKETPAKKDESGIAKSNDIEKCPFPTPFPQALKLPKNLDVTSEILEHLHQVKVNLPLLHLIKQMPLYAKLADRSVRKPRGVVEDVLVKVENFYYTVDFIILDIEPTLHPSANIPIILGRPFLATANALINCRNGRIKITFGSMTAELNIFNVNPQQLVDEECEYVNFIEAAPQEEFNNHCYLDPFETLPLLDEEQVVVAEKPPRSKKKSLLAYPNAPKLKLKPPPRDLPCASIEPHATFTVEVPSKMSVDPEVEKAGEKTKFFERHKTKRKALHDTRL